MAKGDSQEMWGGRFGGKPADLMRQINASIGFDKRLWREDIAASTAHANMLRDQGIIPKEDADAIISGLEAIATEYERDGVPENAELDATSRSRPTSACGFKARRSKFATRSRHFNSSWYSVLKSMPTQ